MLTKEASPQDTSDSELAKQTPHCIYLVCRYINGDPSFVGIVNVRYLGYNLYLKSFALYNVPQKLFFTSILHSNFVSDRVIPNPWFSLYIYLRAIFISILDTYSSILYMYYVIIFSYYDIIYSYYNIIYSFSAIIITSYFLIYKDAYVWVIFNI